ncbi:MAG: hypothetical protein Q8Q09_20690 [Deltaproteobacteria bacterium]|nr:hypothetical protein [Deltaproteobacteria bacterium]
MSDRDNGAADENPEISEALSAAIAAVAADPDDVERWESLDELLQTEQHPEPVATLFIQVLEGEVSKQRATSVGQRALRFFQEWFPEPTAAAPVLERVLHIDPAAEWAFHRLTLMFTHAKRWEELLSLYDRALDRNTDSARRAELLDEATRVARDFAADATRAIRYLELLIPLRPKDNKLAAALERLLEREARYQDLIALWSARLPSVDATEARATRIRIARCWFDHLGDATEALKAVDPLFAETAGAAADECTIAESVLSLSSAPTETRARARDLLIGRFAGDSEFASRARVYESALDFVDGDERAQTLVKLTELHDTLGDGPKALTRAADLVVLVPLDESHRATLLKIATREGAFDVYAQALEDAATMLMAAMSEEPASRLLAEAAAVRAEKLEDPEAAAALFERVLTATDVAAGVKLGAVRWLDTLYGQLANQERQLATLETRAGLEPAEEERRETLARAARLAETMHETDRALVAWSGVLALSADDEEALDASVSILERAERWRDLVEALRRRAASANGAATPRADLTRAARVLWDKLAAHDPAIELWVSVAEQFGFDSEIEDALVTLYSAAERWSDLRALLESSIERTEPGKRRAALATRLASVLSVHLGEPATALARLQTALLDDPSSIEAREQTLALSEDETTAAGAVDSLATAYATCDEWALLLGLLDARLAHADDASTRALLLLDAASTYEERANDAASALQCVARAFVEVPADDEIETQMLRLAELCGDYRVVAEGYRLAIETAPSQATVLRIKCANTLETRVSDQAAALTLFEDVFAAEPDHADAASSVVRVAGRLGRWDVATTAVVRVCSLRSEDRGLLGVLETIAEETEGWDGATQALETVLEVSGMSGRMAHDLEARVAVWHRDHRADGVSAAAAFSRAIAHDHTVPTTLSALAALQRAEPSSALVDTLLRYADAVGDDLASLREAAEVALGPAQDARVESILLRLYQAASKSWSDGDQSAEEHVVWSLEAAVARYGFNGRDAQSVDMLEHAATLPFASGASRELRRRAGALCIEPLADRERAVRLYRSVFDEDSDDADSGAQLAQLYEAQGALEALLSLRGVQLQRSTERDTRIGLRLELSRVRGLLLDSAGAEKDLHDNLSEFAGHRESIERLSSLLIARSADSELVTLLVAQATAVEAEGDTLEAQLLWNRAAQSAQANGDTEIAIRAFGRVAGLGDSPDALDALAALHGARGEVQEAVHRLEQRAALVTDEDRAVVAVRLARAYIAAERSDEAITCLEAHLAVDPASAEARAPLAELYRGAGRWDALAGLLLAKAEYETKEIEQARVLRECADVLVNRLNEPLRAVPVLERAVALMPSDREIRIALAEARCGAEDFDGARALLDTLLSEFGRRRPPERAKVHRILATLARRRGDRRGALAELELASGIDLDDPNTQQMVGEVAWELGEYDHAANAFRSLLLIVRRQDDSVPTSGPSRTEVLLWLYRIARAQDQEDRAAEVLQSAFELSRSDPADARMFEAALLRAGEHALLLQALEHRLSAAQTTADRSETLVAKADALEALGRADEALDTRLQTLDLQPEDAATHDATRAVARRSGQSERYVARLRTLAEANEDRLAAARLFLRAGIATAEDLGDARAAVVDLERAQAEGAPERDVLRALDAAYVAANAREPLRAVLERRADVDGPEDDHEQRVDALYRLAEMDLRDPAQSAEGLATLERALSFDARYDRAANALAEVCERDDAEPSARALFERVARDANDDSLLLRALECVTRHGVDDQEIFRESVEIAQRVGDEPRMRLMLDRAIARGGDGALWAVVSLGRHEAEQKNTERAVELLSHAAQIADASDAIALGCEAAELAKTELGDQAKAVEIYEALFEREPSERSVWEPMLAGYRALEAWDRLASQIMVVREHVYDVPERNRLRVERAGILARTPATQDEAAETLRACLEDDPGDVDAANLLADLLETNNRTAELDEFLQWQLDRARDRGDVRTVVSLSLRLGSRMGPTRRDEVVAIYRGALDWAPKDLNILRALILQYGPMDDQYERSDLLERLLESSTGDEAASCAMELADLYEAREDNEGSLRALQQGFRNANANATLRDRLETALRSVDDPVALAEMILLDAQGRSNPAQALVRFREAASMYAERLGDFGAAADAIAKARALFPEDLDLVSEHARALLASDRAEEAGAVLGTALEGPGAGSPQEAALRRARAAVLRATGELEEAVRELELAFVLDSAASQGELFETLAQFAEQAASDGKREQERAATLRLSQLYADAGDTALAAQSLDAWLDRNGDEREILQQLANLHAEAGRWDAVVGAYKRAVGVLDGDEKLDAVLRLAEAAERAELLGEARDGLEALFRLQPENEPVRAWLRRVYTATDAFSELAELCLEDAKHAPAEAIRFDRLRQGGKLFVDVGRYAEAVPPLESALELRAGDHECTVSLADAYTALGNIEAASGLLQNAINGHRNRRSAELGALQYRMARAAQAVGDQGVQLAWLNAALESDHQNGPVASELAELAMAFDDLDTAMKALRALTLMKNPGPMSKAQAFFRQGVIAFKQGDSRKAVFLAKRALSEDGELSEARELLTQLGE